MCMCIYIYIYTHMCIYKFLPACLLPYLLDCNPAARASSDAAPVLNSCCRW